MEKLTQSWQSVLRAARAVRGTPPAKPMSFAAWAALYHLMAYDQTLADLVKLGAYKELTAAGYAHIDNKGACHLTLAGMDAYSIGAHWRWFRLGYNDYIRRKTED